MRDFLKSKRGAIGVKKTIFVIALCVAANFLGSVFARFFNIPLYLDSVLTIGATSVCGLWAGIATAVLSNGVIFIIDRNMIPFTLCHIATAVFARLVFSSERKRKVALEIDSFIWAGLLSAVSNAVLGNVISDFLYGSNTVENINNSVHAIYLAVPSITFATYFSGFLTNFADKMISAALSFGAYKACKRKFG
ncbi:MAG: hypothetical protein UHY90_00655 [Treponema sp.]|nr:hypothetical protein [Fibrobacteraceae bacterium]MEE1180731.1 hypothetical protein [Treponema sp.]